MKIAEQEHAEGAQLIPRLLGGLVAVVCRYPWPVLAASACLVAFSLVSAFIRLEYRTSRKSRQCMRIFSCWPMTSISLGVGILTLPRERARFMHALRA